MFAFAPSSVYDSSPLHQPRRYRPEAPPLRTYATNPRDRYLAALAEAEAAEAEYVAVIARAKSIQRQKQEEEAAAARWDAVTLQRQRTDTLRRQAALDGIHAHDDYPSYDHYHTTSFPTRPLPRFSAQSQEEALILRELERRRHRQQEEKEAARVAAALELKKRERTETKLRQQQSKLSRYSDEELLNLLSGHGRPSVPKTRSQVVLPPVVSHLLQTLAEPLQHQTPGPTLRTPSHQAPNADRHQPDFIEFLSAVFSGLAEKEEDKAQQPQRSRHVSFEAQPQMPSSSGSYATSTAPVRTPIPNNLKVASLVDIFNRGADKEDPSGIYSTLQSIFGPTFGDTQTSDGNKSAPAVPNAENPALAQTPAEPSTTAGALKDILQTRLNNEPETEVRETLQSLLGSIFKGASHSQAPSATETKAAPSLTPAPASTSGPSLIEELQARLNEDPDVEIRDTIRAIFASLMSAKAPTSASATSPTTTKATSSTSPSTSSDKGKGKAATDLTFGSTTSPTSKDVLDALNAIHGIEDHFAVLTSEFSFPTRLDFTPSPTRPSSPSSDSDSLTTHLAYTSANAPVRYYEQALSALLVQLDAVESYGNDDVRKTRKEVVARVESALEEAERAVRERLVQHQARTVNVSAAAKSLVVAEPAQSEANLTESIAAPVGEIHANGEERIVQDVAEAQTAEEPVVAPDAEPESNPAPSSPPTSSSETANTKHDTETVDTFPIPHQSVNISKRPTSSNGEEELVVVDPHGEASDWSEVDA